MKVYLAGPINGCNDQEANGWRSRVKAELGEDQCIDPMRRDYRGREMEPGIAAEIVQGDLVDIEACDVFLANMPKPSYGTAMELFFARQCEGMRVAFGAEGADYWTGPELIVVIVPDARCTSPWVTHHCDYVAESLVEALEVIELWEQGRE